MSLLSREALPYLKAIVPDDDASPVLKLDALDAPLSRRFLGGLITTYVRDLGDHLEFVAARHLAEARIDEDALRAAALENLVARTNETGVRLVPAGNYFAVLFDGTFEATLLLHSRLWDEIEGHVGGPLAAVVPARDILAVGRANTPDALAALRGVVDRAWSGGDHLLIRDLLMRRDGEWVLTPGS